MGTSITPMGMQQAAAAFRAIERRQEVVANNLANVDTHGFKAERPFAHLLAGGTAPQLGSATDRRQGSLEVTGAPFDVALEADGFFVVETANGEQLTRGGAWRLNDRGELVDGQGARVLAEGLAGGASQPITVPLNAAQVSIARDGTVLADGVVRGRLRVETVPATVALEHLGSGRFAAPPARRALDAEARRVRQGALESSNVTSIESLVQLIDIQRAYGSVQRAVSAIDAARGVIVSDIARPL